MTRRQLSLSVQDSASEPTSARADRNTLSVAAFVSILSIRKADKCNLGLGRYRGWDWFGCLLTVGADNLDCRLLLNIPEVSANRPVHGHALGGRQQRLLAPLGLPRRCRSPALHEARRWSGERQSRHCVVGAQAPHALTIGARCIPPPGSDPESELRDELPTLFRHPAGCPVRRRCVIANEEARAHGIALLAAREIDACAGSARGRGQFRHESTRARAWIWRLAPVYLREILELWPAKAWPGAYAVLGAMGHEVGDRLGARTVRPAAGHSSDAQDAQAQESPGRTIRTS